MTSPLRRKRPTTPPNSRPKNSRESRVESREPERRRLRFSAIIEGFSAFFNLHFSFCKLQSPVVALLLLVTTLAIATPATAGELQWRSGRTGASKPAKQTSSLRFKRPTTPRHRADFSLRQAAFEEQGPQLASGSEGSARLRSIVVERADGPESTRSAQLPPTATETTPDEAAESPGTAGQPTTESPLEDLGTPFGDMPELEQPGELDAEMPLPQDGQTLPPDSTLQPPAGRQPFDTTPGEFQPSVPPTFEATPGIPDVVPTPPAAAVEADRQNAEQACTDSLTNLRENTIDKLSLTISVTGTEGTDYPFECTIDDGTWHPGRTWPQTTYMWKASALCHKPLYFEDEHLERYGHSWPGCCQPLVSGAHFFTRLPVLPYCMGVEPPMECVYALGHYRPGNCAPYLCDPIPISARGALFQAGAVVGAAAVLP